MLCEVCTEAVHSVALWTRVTLQLWTCVKYVPKQSLPVALWNTGLHHNFGHVWSMYRSSPFRSTFNTGYITTSDMCEVCTEAVHSVALWTRVYITTLDMCEVCTEAVHSVELWARFTLQLWTLCEVCTEAVHSVALWTRVTLQLWTCVKYVLKQSIP